MGVDLVTTHPTLTGAPNTQVEVLGDSAYASGDMLATLNNKGWTPVVKPWPLRPAIEGGFTLDDFARERHLNMDPAQPVQIELQRGVTFLSR